MILPASNGMCQRYCDVLNLSFPLVEFILSLHHGIYWYSGLNHEDYLYIEMNEPLREILRTNPTIGKTVFPISIQVCSDTNETDEIPSTVCGWIPTPLEPPGPVAAVLWKTNPEFRAGSLSVRKTILRETIIGLQERVERELRGHRWSRKKIMEQLVAQQSADASPPQNTRELNDALAFLYEIQFVFVDEANKRVSWSPEDVRVWSTTRPIWALSLGSRAIFHKTGEESVGKELGIWISNRELENWRIQWPVADGTLEDLKGRFGKMNISSGFRIEKPKKADYASAIGRVEAIQNLTKFSEYNV
jgi:hypothetical protein